MKSKIKVQSAKVNLILQIVYQITIFVIPLIVSPFLTRRLGDTSLGIYSYTYSIAFYFVVFAMLGISRHGQRIIASRRDDSISLRKTFWSLYTVHAFFSVLAIFAYIIFIVFFGDEYKNIYYIQIIYVASALFDITWLFYGLENFKSVVTRSIFVRIAECVLIFCVIKSSADLWKYTLIMSCSLCIGQAIMLPQAIYHIKPIKFGWADVKEHLKPLFVLFIAVVAATLYTVFDKTLLGIFSTKENVAYYDYSNRIINIPKAVIDVIGTVLFPRACACLAKGDIKNTQRYMNYALHFTCLLGLGSIFGLVGISNLFAKLYYGESFAICGNVIIALSPAIFIIELGSIIRTQYMVPNHMDVSLSVCYIINAVLNLILSIILIPYLGIYGAVIGTLSAELFGLCFQLILCRKFLSLKKVVVTMLPYLFLGLLMFAIIYLIRMHFNTSWFDLLFQMLMGGGVYVALSSAYLLLLSPIKRDLRKALRRGKKDNIQSTDDNQQL